MVMFNCNRCSAGLRKKDVLNHSFKCGGKSNINLTCADCLKDFKGNEYETHTSCVSEEARYGGKGFVAKETGKKQNQWLGIVRQVLEKGITKDPSVIKFLNLIQNHENIPRNKKKFQNWAHSALHVRDESFLNQVFDILQQEFARLNETKKSESKNGAKDENGANLNESVVETTNETASEEKPAKKKKSKRHNLESEAVNSVEENGANGVQEVGEIVEKKKKKKRSSVVAEDLAPEENGKLDEDSAEGENKSSENGTKSSKEPEEPSAEAEPTTEGDHKLSKKEKKLKKKKAKFEAEVMEIENFKKEEVEEVTVEEERKPKKSKKRKLAADTTETGEVKSETEKSSTKKPKIDDSLVENENHKTNLEEDADSPSKKEKFKWHDNILSVLKKSKDSEVLVKKMAKKIIGEYVAQYGDKAIHEKLNSKLNKKLKTCPGVRVLKDKVRLVETDD